MPPRGGLNTHQLSATQSPSDSCLPSLGDYQPRYQIDELGLPRAGLASNIRLPDILDYQSRHQTAESHAQTILPPFQGQPSMTLLDDLRRDSGVQLTSSIHRQPSALYWHQPSPIRSPRYTCTPRSAPTFGRAQHQTHRHSVSESALPAPTSPAEKSAAEALISFRGASDAADVPWSPSRSSKRRRGISSTAELDGCNDQNEIRTAPHAKLATSNMFMHVAQDRTDHPLQAMALSMSRGRRIMAYDISPLAARAYPATFYNAGEADDLDHPIPEGSGSSSDNDTYVLSRTAERTDMYVCVQRECSAEQDKPDFVLTDRQQAGRRRRDNGGGAVDPKAFRPAITQFFGKNRGEFKKFIEALEQIQGQVDPFHHLCRQDYQRGRHHCLKDGRYEVEQLRLVENQLQYFEQIVRGQGSIEWLVEPSKNTSELLSRTREGSTHQTGDEVLKTTFALSLKDECKGKAMSTDALIEIVRRMSRAYKRGHPGYRGEAGEKLPVQLPSSPKYKTGREAGQQRTSLEPVQKDLEPMEAATHSSSQRRTHSTADASGAHDEDGRSKTVQPVGGTSRRTTRRGQKVEQAHGAEEVTSEEAEGKKQPDPPLFLFLPVRYLNHDHLSAKGRSIW